MLYLDSSALVKLVIRERESGDLQERLRESRSEMSLSSLVAAVEVPRAVARATDEHAAVRRADEVLAAVDLRQLDEDVIAAAGTVGADVRSLDAIHLGTAITLRDDIDAFIAYDRRLLEAAQAAGLPAVAPGA